MTVKMKHCDTGKEADVHTDEVANYQAGGYIVVEQEKPKRGRPAKKVLNNGSTESE